MCGGVKKPAPSPRRLFAARCTSRSPPLLLMPGLPRARGSGAAVRARARGRRGAGHLFPRLQLESTRRPLSQERGVPRLGRRWGNTIRGG